MASWLLLLPLAEAQDLLVSRLRWWVDTAYAVARRVRSREFVGASAPVFQSVTSQASVERFAA